MELLLKTLLYTHLFSGGLGLLSGTINIIRRKGNRKHRFIGKIFVFNMLINGCTAIALSCIHKNEFLFITGIFTMYMTITGQRYLSLRGLNARQKPKFIDWFLNAGMLLIVLAFMADGIYQLYQAMYYSGIMFLLAGCFGLYMAGIDIKNFTGNGSCVNYWLTAHLQRMIGTYIAVLTSFLVANVKYLPKPLPVHLLWYLPTFLLMPVIFKWRVKYRLKRHNNAL